MNLVETPSISRRKALQHLSVLAATTVVPPWTKVGSKPDLSFSISTLRKIATEEAFNIPEIAPALKDLVQKGSNNLDNLVLKTDL